MTKKRNLPTLPSQKLIDEINNCNDCHADQTGARIHLCCIDDVDEAAKLNKMHFDTPDASNDNYYGPFERDIRATAFMNGWFQLTWIRDEDYDKFWWDNQEVLQQPYSEELAKKLIPYGRLAPHKRRKSRPQFDHTDAVREEAETLVRDAVKEMLRVTRRKANDLPIAKGWKPKISFDWSPTRKRSKGGNRKTGKKYLGGGISLAMNRRVPIATSDSKDIYRFDEYSHIAHDPTIGTVESHDWRIILKALVAHELAHAIQSTIPRTGRHRNIDYRKAHGEGWQRIYALLRRECVNPHITPNKDAT